MFMIDTLNFSRNLERAGMQKRIADVLAEGIKEAQIQSSKHLATKGDLTALGKELRQEIKIAMLTTIISLGAIMALIEKFIGN
jgi:hypothetical protein